MSADLTLFARGTGKRPSHQPSAAIPLPKRIAVVITILVLLRLAAIAVTLARRSLAGLVQSRGDEESQSRSSDERLHDTSPQCGPRRSVVMCVAFANGIARANILFPVSLCRRSAIKRGGRPIRNGAPCWYTYRLSIIPVHRAGPCSRGMHNPTRPRSCCTPEAPWRVPR